MVAKKETKASPVIKKETLTPVPEKKYVWMEDFLALLNLRKSIKTVRDAKKTLAEIESTVDVPEKQKKAELLTEVLRDLVVEEDKSAVSAKEEADLRRLGSDDALNVEKLGEWIEKWGEKEEVAELTQMGKILKEKKDKSLITPEKRQKMLDSSLLEQSREKAEMNAQVESLIRKLDVESGPEIEKIKKELYRNVSEFKRISIPKTSEELKKTQKSIVEWTKKLKAEDWKRLIENEPDADLVPLWVKKIVGDERIEVFKRKAVLNELLGGVEAIDSLERLVSKGLPLEDALKRLSIQDRDKLGFLYKKEIYRDLRESDSGLLGLLERVEVVKNPWREIEKTASVGEGGRRELRGEVDSPRGDRLDRLEKLIDVMTGGALPTDTEAETEGLDESIRRKSADKTNFQIFNNIDYRILPEEIRKYIDFEKWDSTRGAAPAYVHREVLENPVELKKFLDLWRDRTRLALRKIAYQQSESKHQDPVMAELTTLLSILGVPSSEKGMIKVEAQVYGMVDALMRGAGNKETFAKLFSIFESNGVGFRLIDKLKEHREKVYWVKQGVYSGIKGEDEDDTLKVTNLVNDKGKELRMGAFDFMRVMGHRLSAEELTEVGLPAGTKMMWGTAIYRKSVDVDIEKIKKSFMKRVLGERGVKNADAKEWFGDVFDFYQDYIDEAVYFKGVQAEIDGIVGNASLKPGEYEFPAGLKEYLVGKMSIQGTRYFEAKYGNGNVDEMVGLLDGGIRSIAVMARTELVNHLIGETTTTEGNLGASEVYFSKVTDLSLKNRLTKNWNELWKKSLYHHGNTHGVHHDPTNMFTSFGDEGSIDSGLLRPTWNTIEVLRANRHTDAVKELIPYIDYSEFVKIVKDDDLAEFLMSGANSADAKFDKFIERFGEDYRSYSGEKSKRWSDWPVKYWISKMDEAFALIQELSSDPYNVGVQKKLLDLYNSTNAGGTPAYQRMMQEAIEWYAKNVGMMGTYTRYKRKIDGDRTSLIFDPSKGIYGNDQEFPGIVSEEAGGVVQEFKIAANEKGLGNKVEKIWKTLKKFVVGSLTGDPTLKNNSLAASYGHGGVGEWSIRQMLLERRAAGFYKNPEQFSKEWGKWAKGILWNKDKTILENSWNWFTFNAPFEYVGMVYFGVQGHKFKEIFMEESEKNIEKMLHYLNH